LVTEGRGQQQWQRDAVLREVSLSLRSRSLGAATSSERLQKMSDNSTADGAKSLRRQKGIRGWESWQQ
jgi:hypothetical protein